MIELMSCHGRSWRVGGAAGRQRWWVGACDDAPEAAPDHDAAPQPGAGIAADGRSCRMSAPFAHMAKSLRDRNLRMTAIFDAWTWKHPRYNPGCRCSMASRHGWVKFMTGCECFS